MTTKPTAEELQVVMEKHRLWLEDAPGGERANLRFADLRDADLRFANLRDADLRFANLRFANLRNADLRDANLRFANLRFANLRDANLRLANLRDADLRDADLRDADLLDANLAAAEFSIRIFSFGPFGTARQMTIYRPACDEVRSGCWKGTLEEFRTKVASQFAEGTELRLLFEAGTRLFEAGEEAERREPKPDSVYQPKEKP